MKPKLLTVLVSYNRPHLLRQAISSYLATVTVRNTLVVVDNGSDEETREAILELGVKAILLDENRYPGYAMNRAWEAFAQDHTLLHRGDNDFAFLDGWCSEVVERFRFGPLALLGMRTDEEEEFAYTNAGGNAVLRREWFDRGVRYDERPWSPRYHTEDYYICKTIEEMGGTWHRVTRPCIRTLASGDFNDPYYVQSHADRGYLESALARTPKHLGGELE